MNLSSNILETFKKLEKDNIVELLKYKKTTAWIDVKNYLYSKSLDGVVELAVDNKRAFFTLDGIKLLMLSILYYIKAIFKRADILYVGAGSGLFEYDNKILDSYLPKEIEAKSCIYMLSAEYPKRLMEYKSYLKDKNIIIYSFLIAPLKIVFTKLFNKFISVNKDAFEVLNSYSLDITQNELNYIYTKFVVSYNLYKLFLAPFRIKRAYVVSAYSNTELIAVLKSRGVEVIELQHGLLGSVHRGYNYASKSKLLPTPNRVYVYNSFWREELIKAGFYKDKQVEISGRLKYDLIKKDIIIYDNKYIVFTGQGGFYKEIESFFKSALSVLKDKNLKLIYLPHPNESKDILENLKREFEDNYIKILINKEWTTEQYIYNSIAHISVYSSCHFDAVHYKNRTYIFDIMQDNPMEYYIKNFSDRFVAIKDIGQIKELD